MSTDHDIMRLPDPPPPAPDARAAAVQQALLRFDQKSAGNGQGMPTDIRLIERTAAPLRPSRERLVIKRTRYLLAASLACIVAGSGAYLHLMRSPPLQDAAAPVERKVASNDVAQAPSTVQAKRESESQAQPQAQIQTALRPQSPTRKPPRLRLRRRRLPPSRRWKIRSPACRSEGVFREGARPGCRVSCRLLRS